MNVSKEAYLHIKRKDLGENSETEKVHKSEREMLYSRRCCRDIQNEKQQMSLQRLRGPCLVAFYDIRSGSGVGIFLQPRSPHGGKKHQVSK